MFFFHKQIKMIVFSGFNTFQGKTGEKSFGKKLRKTLTQTFSWMKYPMLLAQMS